MSAWIVSQNHIALLVEACFKYKVVKPEDGTPDDVGQMLWEENHRSINYRYNEDSQAPQYMHNSRARGTGLFRYHIPSRDGHTTREVTIPNALGTIRELIQNGRLLYKQIRCYCSQACEHPAWEQSASCRLMADLAIAVEKSMGMTADEIEQYPRWDAHPWGID